MPQTFGLSYDQKLTSYAYTNYHHNCSLDEPITCLQRFDPVGNTNRYNQGALVLINIRVVPVRDLSLCEPLIRDHHPRSTQNMTAETDVLIWCTVPALENSWLSEHIFEFLTHVPWLLAFFKRSWDINSPLLKVSKAIMYIGCCHQRDVGADCRSWCRWLRVSIRVPGMIAGKWLY